jgi:hypothetical protein
VGYYSALWEYQNRRASFASTILSDSPKVAEDEGRSEVLPYLINFLTNVMLQTFQSSATATTY